MLQELVWECQVCKKSLAVKGLIESSFVDWFCNEIWYYNFIHLSLQRLQSSMEQFWNQWNRRKCIL